MENDAWIGWVGRTCRVQTVHAHFTQTRPLLTWSIQKRAPCSSKILTSWLAVMDVEALPFPKEGILPKAETEASKFIEEHRE